MEKTPIMNPGHDLSYHAETHIRYTIIIWVIEVPTENDMVYLSTMGVKSETCYEKYHGKKEKKVWFI